ncbi:MAG: ABC transporter permease [Chloroflexota bacterium]
MQPLPVLKYSASKLLKLLSLLVAVATFSFVMLALSPIDPVDAYIGADMMLVSPEQRELIAERWGLNDPPVERFLAWGEQVLQGNLGTSLIYNRPVIEVIGTRFMASLWLMLTAWVFSGVLGFTLGVLASAYPDSLLDRAIRFYAYTQKAGELARV